MLKGLRAASFIAIIIVFATIPTQAFAISIPDFGSLFQDDFNHYNIKKNKHKGGYGWGDDDDGWHGGDDDDGGGNDIPLDGGLSFLAIAGAGYGVKTVVEKRNKKKSK